LARGILQVINGCLKAHIGVDAESGLVDWRGRHGGEWVDVTQVHQLLMARKLTSGDGGYTGGTSVLSIRTAKMICRLPPDPA